MLGKYRRRGRLVADIEAVVPFAWSLGNLKKLHRQYNSFLAKFLNTSATNYFLEELIKDAKDRLILISPFLKLNDRVKELLSDKNRLKIDVRIVYGKPNCNRKKLVG